MRDSNSVQRGPFDAESGGFESGDNVVDGLWISRLANHFDQSVLRRKLGEDPAVVDLDDIHPSSRKDRRDSRERAGLVMGVDVKPRHATLADEVSSP